MNNCSFIGRAGKDAETRFTASGKSVTGWSLAVDTGFGENKSTVWIDCSAWSERFEKVGTMIKKGDRIGVTGEIGTREHNEKTYVTLNVLDVTLLGNKPNESAAGAPRGKPPQQPAMAGGGEHMDDEIPFAPRGKRSHFA